MANFVTISWGSIRLWCSTVSTERSRNVIVHDLTSGSLHPTYDSGPVAGRTTCSLLFDDFPGETDDGKVRLQKLEIAVAQNKPAIFNHPLFGSWMAIVGKFTPTIDEHGVCSADIEFIPDESVEKVSPSGAGIPGVVGEASVTAAVDNLETAIDDSNLGDLLDDLEDSPLDISADALTVVAGWNEGESIPSREIFASVADLSSRLSVSIDVLGMEDDLAFFDIFQATIMLGDAIRAAAIAQTSETPNVFVMRVKTPVVIIRLCAQIYGGYEAEERERQVIALNDIRTPGWYGPGDLLLPVKGSSLTAF